MRGAPTDLANVERALSEYGPHGESWIEAMWRGDPVADAVAADLTAMGFARGNALLRTALAHGIEAAPDAPDSVRALLAEVTVEPAWLRRDRLDRAAAHLVRHSAEYGIALAAASLLSGAANTIASKPLMMTGRYGSDAAKRSTEVGVWLAAVTTPGGLEPHAPGWVNTVRVRAIHSHVRLHLAERPAWDHDAWGVPIPQPYMMFTLCEFGSIALRAMHSLGVRYTPAELDDIYHLWRYVGFLIGVDDDLNPVCEADQHRIEELYALTAPGPDDSEREFVQALGNDYLAPEIARMVPGGVLERIAPQLVAGLERAFLGEDLADDLHIPDTRWKHLPRVVSPVSRAAYAIRYAVPGGKDRHAQRAFVVRERELQRLRDTHGVQHELVDDQPSGLPQTV